MLGLSLRAVNSTDNLRFEIWYDENSKDFPATILGIFDGKNLQIDFNALSIQEMQELINFLQLRLAQAKAVGVKRSAIEQVLDSILPEPKG